MMNDQSNAFRIELLRSKSADEISAVSHLLTEASVPHRVSDTKAGFDITEIGRGDDPSDILITVEHSDYENARQVMEQSYSESDLPEDHFLHSASDHELLEILSCSAEWSAFDVAHARKIACQRKLDTSTLAAKKEERIDILRQGKPAPRYLLYLGWGTAFLGGVISIGIGYSLAYLKETTPEGEFPAYDESSRKIGRKMMFFGLFMLVAVRLLWVLYVRH